MWWTIPVVIGSYFLSGCGDSKEGSDLVDGPPPSDQPRVDPDASDQQDCSCSERNYNSQFPPKTSEQEDFQFSKEYWSKKQNTDVFVRVSTPEVSPKFKSSLANYIFDQTKACGEKLMQDYGLQSPPPFNRFKFEVKSPGAKESTSDSTVSLDLGKLLFDPYNPLMLGASRCYDSHILNELTHRFFQEGLLYLNRTDLTPTQLQQLQKKGLFTDRLTEGHARYVELTADPLKYLVAENPIDLNEVRNASQSFEACYHSRDERCQNGDKEERKNCCLDSTTGLSTFLQVPQNGMINSVLSELNTAGGFLFITGVSSNGRENIQISIDNPSISCNEGGYTESPNGLAHHCYQPTPNLPEMGNLLFFNRKILSRNSIDCQDGSNIARESIPLENSELVLGEVESLYHPKDGNIEDAGACFFRSLEEKYGPEKFGNMMQKLQLQEKEIATVSCNKILTNLIEEMANALETSPQEIEAEMRQFNIAPEAFGNGFLSPYCSQP